MNREDTNKFLAALYGDHELPSGFIAIDDLKKGRPAQQRRGHYDDLADELEYLNNQGFGIFFYVNELGEDYLSENVVRPIACFVDSDDGPLDPDSMPVQPHLIVSSNRGHHLYWRLDYYDTLEHWTEMQNRLADKLGTDRSLGDHNQVMRLPGTDHWKTGKPIPVTWEDTLDQGGTYGYVDLVDGFGLTDDSIRAPSPGGSPPPHPETATGARMDTPRDTRYDKCRAYVLKIPGAVEGEHGDDHTYRVATMGGDFGLSEAEFWPIFAEWNRTCSPPWSDKELLAKLRHGYKYRNRPEGEKLAFEPGSGGSSGHPDDNRGPSEGPSDSGAKTEAADHRLAFHTPSDAIDQWLEQSERRFVPSFIPALDRATGGGFPVAAVTAVLAYTGSYKSEFARKSVVHAAKEGHPVFHIDVELGLMHIMERHVAELSGVLPSHLRDKSKRTVHDLEAINQAVSELRSQRWRVQCPGSGLPLETLRTCIMRGMPPIRDDRRPLIVLDSAQRLAHGVTGEDARGRVERFFIWAEDLAKELDAAVLLIHEQSRAATGGKPKVGSLLTSGAESRAVEYTTSVLIGLYPDFDDLDDEDVVAGDADDEAETAIAMVIGKNRPGGILGHLKDQVVMLKPYWRHEIRTKKSRKAQDILAAMLPGEQYSINAVQKIVGGKKTTVRRELHQLSELGLLLEAKFHDKPTTWTKPREP